MDESRIKNIYLSSVNTGNVKHGQEHNKQRQKINSGGFDVFETVQVTEHRLRQTVTYTSRRWGGLVKASDSIQKQQVAGSNPT